MSPAALMALFVLVGLAWCGAWLVRVEGVPSWAEGRLDRDRVARGLRRTGAAWPFVLLALGVLAFHVLAVNVLEPLWRPWWLGVTGVDFAAWMEAFENGAVRSFEALHWRPLTWAVAWFYLVLHHAMVILWPLWLLASGRTGLGKQYLVALAFTYLLAQPGWIFLPIDNPTVHFGLPSRIGAVIPGADAVFYRGTTLDNTVPSGHVALATLGFLHGRASGNRRVAAFATVYGPLVAFSVLYLQVHWVLDVPAGVAVALLGTWLAGRVLRPRHSRETPGPS